MCEKIDYGIRDISKKGLILSMGIINCRSSDVSVAYDIRIFTRGNVLLTLVFLIIKPEMLRK